MEIIQFANCWFTRVYQKSNIVNVVKLDLNQANWQTLDKPGIHQGLLGKHIPVATVFPQNIMNEVMEVELSHWAQLRRWYFVKHPWYQTQKYGAAWANFFEGV